MPVQCISTKVVWVRRIYVCSTIGKNAKIKWAEIGEILNIIPKYAPSTSTPCEMWNMMKVEGIPQPLQLFRQHTYLMHYALCVSCKITEISFCFDVLAYMLRHSHRKLFIVLGIHAFTKTRRHDVSILLQTYTEQITDKNKIKSNTEHKTYRKRVECENKGNDMTPVNSKSKGFS